MIQGLHRDYMPYSLLRTNKIMPTQHLLSVIGFRLTLLGFRAGDELRMG